MTVSFLTQGSAAGSIITGVIHKALRLFPILLILLLGACSPELSQTVEENVDPAPSVTVEGLAASATLPPTAAPATATLPSTTTPMIEPTVQVTGGGEQSTTTPVPSPTSEPPAQQVISGQTAEGAFFLGAPEAPLTVIDYSDFL